MVTLFSIILLYFLIWGLTLLNYRIFSGNILLDNGLKGGKVGEAYERNQLYCAMSILINHGHVIPNNFYWILEFFAFHESLLYYTEGDLLVLH